MSVLQSLAIESFSDDALVERLYQLATADDQQEDGELRSLDAAVYGRLSQAYGEPANGEPVRVKPIDRAPETSMPETAMGTLPDRL